MQPAKSKSKQVLEYLYRYAVEKHTSELIETMIPYGNIGMILWEVARNIYEIISNASEEDRSIILNEIQQASPQEIDSLSTELSNDPNVIYPINLSESERKAVAKGIYQTLRQIPNQKANPQQILQSINQGLFGGKNIISIHNVNRSRVQGVGSAVVSTLVNSNGLELAVRGKQHQILQGQTQAFAQYPIIDGFEIKGILGEGAYAKVYLANEQLGNGKWRTCALKVGVLESEARFKREVQNMQLVDHPHVLSCWRTGRFQEQGILKYWIAMPNMGGLTLEHLILGNTLDLETKLLLLMQIADGLEALHEKNIIHRDLKPSNCLISSDFQLKISDFGLSKDLNNSIDSTQSQNADAIGTPAYMSPENIEGNISYYSDVWAFGIIAFELLSGNLPWGRQIKPLVLVANILYKEIDVISQLKHLKLPINLINIVDQCLKRDASKRYQHGSELKSDFYRIAKEERNRLRHNRFKESWCLLIEKNLIEQFIFEAVQSGHTSFQLESFLSMPEVIAFPLALDTERLSQVLDVLSQMSLEITLAHELKIDVNHEQLKATWEDQINLIRLRLREEIVEELKDFDQMLEDRKIKAKKEQLARDKQEKMRLDEEAKIRKKKRTLIRNLILGGLVLGGGGKLIWLGITEDKQNLKIIDTKNDSAKNDSAENDSAERMIHDLEGQLKIEKLKNQVIAIRDDLIKTTNFTFVLIKGGSFMMGREDSENHEKPVHSVIVKDFYMSKTEVTVKQYKKCVDVGICSQPKDRYSNTYCNWGYKDRENYPINCVDWDQARTFAKWIGGDLPSEAQWEYASRSSGKEIKHPWGNEDTTCEHAVISDGINECSEDRTSKVCSKTKGNTAQGLCDMKGNVWEWVLDEWHGSYIDAPSDEIAWCKDKSCEGNPSTHRVNRGGSWFNDTSISATRDRNFNSSNRRNSNLGFRVSTRTN